jgi:ketol-acid reductoisomerase
MEEVIQQSVRQRLQPDFMSRIDTNVIDKNFNEGKDGHVDNRELIEINDEIRYSEVEIIGAELREAMESMKAII